MSKSLHITCLIPIPLPTLPYVFICLMAGNTIYSCIHHPPPSKMWQWQCKKVPRIHDVLSNTRFSHRLKANPPAQSQVHSHSLTLCRGPTVAEKGRIPQFPLLFKVRKWVLLPDQNVGFIQKTSSFSHWGKMRDYHVETICMFFSNGHWRNRSIFQRLFTHTHCTSYVSSLLRETGIETMMTREREDWEASFRLVVRPVGFPSDATNPSCISLSLRGFHGRREGGTQTGLERKWLWRMLR